MDHKLSTVILFIALPFCVNTSIIHAANTINLSGGQVVCQSPNDRPYCVPEQELFSDLVLTIAENGAVTGQAQRSISFEHAGAREGTSESFSGSTRINIRGTYDFNQRTLSGKYDYKLNLSYIVHRGGGEDSDPLNRTGNYDQRAFSGKADGDSYRINFEGLGEVVYGGINYDEETSEDPNENSYTKEFEKNAGQKIIYEYSAGGGFSDMFGQVEVNVPQPDGSYDEEDWSFAKLDGKTLPPGTRIKTSGKSGAILSFGSNTYFMGPESELEIVKDPAQPGNVELLWGNLKANVKKMMKDGSMEIEMSQAVAGIKGTILVLSEDKTHSTLKVIEGVVAFQSKANAKTEIVYAGETITATKNGLGQKQTFDMAAENKKWETQNQSNDSNDNKVTDKKIKDYVIVGAIILILSAILLLVVKNKKSKRDPN
jgi:hypothetical protein